jgi:hypothetical protein
MSFLSGVFGLFLTLAGLLALQMSLFDAHTSSFRPDWGSAALAAACAALGGLMLWRGFRVPSKN